MKRTTVYLEEQTDLDLSQLARQQGRPKAELIREALSVYVAQRASRPLPRSVGMGRSGVPDLAEHDEELLHKLYEEKYTQVMKTQTAEEVQS